jgi:hypothetical protein
VPAGTAFAQRGGIVEGAAPGLAVDRRVEARDVTQLPEPENLVFRPSRRSLWWLIPLQIALPVVFGLLVLREWPVLMAITVTAFVALNAALTYVMKVSSRTAIEPEGLRVRVIGERLFPWPEIQDAGVMQTPMGTVVRVAMTNGFVLALNVPRGGLLGDDRSVDRAITAIRGRVAACRARSEEPGTTPPAG